MPWDIKMHQLKNIYSYINHKEFPLRWRLSQRSLASLLGYYILVGDPYKPPFPTATGWGCLPIDALTVAYTVLLPTSSHIFICLDHTWTSYGTRILSCPLALSSMYDLRVALWRPAIPSKVSLKAMWQRIEYWQPSTSHPRSGSRCGTRTYGSVLGVEENIVWKKFGRVKAEKNLRSWNCSANRICTCDANHWVEGRGEMHICFEWHTHNI